MLPIRLSLRNFLSYQEANIDFKGLHTICICGSNGAGKSSLLEAMTWALWGQSRAIHDDDLIHGGEAEVQVDFIFQSQQQCYRVLRSHQRKQSTVLEFQMVQEREGGEQNLGLAKEPYRSLTEKGLRVTQQRIIDTLRLDYETFINSAYLRQGRADEFMLKRPSERKQVLADLLKLEQYDGLAEKAKERSRQFNAQAQVLRESLRYLDHELEKREVLEVQWQHLTLEIQELQQQQEQDRSFLEDLRKVEQEQQRSLQQRSFLQQQSDRLQREQKDCENALEAAQQELIKLQEYLRDSEHIEADYQAWQSLQQQEELLSHKGIQFQALQHQRSQLQGEQDRRIQEMEMRQQKLITEKEHIQQSIKTIEASLARKEDIQSASLTLQKARENLDRLDRLQAQVMPLKQRQEWLRLELQQIQTQGQTRLVELRPQLEQFKILQTQIPQFEVELLKINDEIKALEKLQNYRSQLREKGQERKSFLERLQAHQRDYEAQLQEMDQSQDYLEPGADCPLCRRPLDEFHWEQVQQYQAIQRQEIVDMLFVVRDQLMVSDREIQVLREEYRRVDQEISRYPVLTEARGKLQQQLFSFQQSQPHYEAICSEFEHLDRCQKLQIWNPQLQAELAHIEQQLSELNYDDRSHALARGEVERWRWADIRASELRSQEKEILRLGEKLPQLNKSIADLEEQKKALESSEIDQQIQQLTIELQALDYDLDTHDRFRQHLRSAQEIPLQYQALQQAKHKRPQLVEHIAQLQAKKVQCDAEFQDLQRQLEDLQAFLQTSPLQTQQNLDLEKLNQKIKNDRHRLDKKLADLGRLEQSRASLVQLIQQRDSQYQDLESCQYQAQLYTELMQAFGKNGLQALLIETLLPQLETETNAILSRLTSHQLHVQFITQRSSRSHPSSEKLIDTLDIRIADLRGTRPYETYSGGEAFRVNFAIRLALARILTQRSGSPLQLLIVDEGFGTQDEAGCDRLIAAINAIAEDFSCILMITHIPHFKEAFQTRLEVEKTSRGSQVRLVL